MINPIKVIESATIPDGEDDQDDFQNFVLNIDALKNILLDPKIADKKVCVISVAGAFRTGKSFILNFFIRYLKYQSKLLENDEKETDWLSTENQLSGFSWRGGDDRDTNGILFWPEPFILRDKNGEEVVIILMDTQGIFDSVSTVKSCATIFALSTMVASIQVYNINKTIQEDHLQHLQLFTEYAKLALDETNEKPFQTLFFLVRDWSFPYDAEYGIVGGQRILEKRLEVNSKQHTELQQLRQHIRESFADLKCFLSPHPGLEVATNPHFRGELNSMNPEFCSQLRALVPHLFDPNNLVVKAINGQQVTCRELAVYFNAYFEVFRGSELPEPKTILNATAEANNLAAVAKSKAHYMKQMEEICGADSPFMATAELLSNHQRCRDQAIDLFNISKKMGGKNLADQYREKLDDDIKTSFESFKRLNSSKNLFKSMRTPAVLVCMMIVNYIFQEFFQLLGMDMVASLFSLVLTIVIGLLVTWTYSRYSGQLRDLQKMIDELVKIIWRNIAPALVNTAGGIALNMATGDQTHPNSTLEPKKNL